MEEGNDTASHKDKSYQTINLEVRRNDKRRGYDEELRQDNTFAHASVGKSTCVDGRAPVSIVSETAEDMEEASGERYSDPDHKGEDEADEEGPIEDAE